MLVGKPLGHRVRNRFKTLLLGCAILPVLSVYADAAVSDRPYFRANSIIIVFSGGDFVENTGEAAIVTDFVLLDNVASGTQGNSLILEDNSGPSTTIDLTNNDTPPPPSPPIRSWLGI